MKVARWYNNRDIRIEDESRPKPGEHEMLVEIFSCGICGSDLVEWYRLPRAPLVPGHEIGGRVVETGSAVTGYKPGDRVFIAPKVPCMTCERCAKGEYTLCSNVKERLPGGFAEYILVPEILVSNGTYRLPDSISFDQSTFIEPLACVVKAQNTADVQAGQTVLIFGCGMSGLLHIKLAKSKNCRVIGVDISEKKLDMAESVGADLTIRADLNVPEILLSENGRKAEVVILCTSALPAVEQAWSSVVEGGTVEFFAVPDPDKKVEIPINDFWQKEIKVLTSYYCGPPDLKEAIHLIEAGTVQTDDLISEKLPLDQTARGFEMLIDDKDVIKVIITPNTTS